MPYVPDDNEAALLLDSVEGEQDASRKAVMVDLLGRYRDQKAATGLKPFQPDQATQRASRERLEGMFAGLDKMDAGLDPAQKSEFATAVDASADKNEAKARMANQTWVVSQYPQLGPAVDADWTRVKHHVAKELFGNDAQGIPDTAFYSQIGGYIKKQQAERDMLADVLSKVQVEAAKGTGDWLAAWKKGATGISANAGYQPTNWDRYRQAAKKVFDDTQQSIQALRPAISAGQEYYRLATVGPVTKPGKDDGKGGVMPKSRDEMDADYEQAVVARQTFLEELMRLPAGQRDQALNLAIAGAADLAPKEMGAEGQAGGAQKTAVSLERAIGNFFPNVARFALQGARAASEITLQARNAYYGEQDTPQQAVYNEQAAMQRTDMSAAIDAGLSDAVDPIKSKSRLAQGVYDAMQSVPYMLAAGAQPEIGIPLTLSAMAEDNRRQFVANGVPAQEAATLALAAAVPQVAIERLQANMLFHGKLPGAEKWLTKAVGTKIGLATKLLAVGGLEALHENAEEALQDITPLAYQELGSILSKDVPDVNWKQELAQYAGQRVDTFFALLPMVLIGTGTASFKESAYGRQYLSNKTMLKAAGFTEAAAEEISQIAVKGDVEKAQALVQSGWEDPAVRPKAEIEKDTAAAKADVDALGKFNTEEQQRAFDELDAGMKSSWNEQQNPAGARAIKNEDGTWTVVDGKNQYVDLANSPDHAVDLVNEVNRADSANLTAVVDDMIDYYKQRGRGGEIVKTGDIRTVQDRVDQGDLGQERANQLVNLYVELGVLPKGTTPQEARIYGESARVYNAKRKVFEYVSRLHDGADPLVLVEEEAESYFKQAVDAGHFSVQDVEQWRAAVEGKPVQPKADKAMREREATEWFSRYAQAYITGKTQQDAPVPLTFRRWLDKMKKVFAEIFQLGRDLIEKEKAGQLPDDFKKHLARSVGLDDAFIEDRMRQEEREQAATSASGNWRAAEALQEIKLPTPKREAAGWSGELSNLWESLKFDQRMKLFAAHDKSLDQVAELLREDYGFSGIKGPDDVVKLAEDTFLHGKEITSDRDGGSTMALRKDGGYRIEGHKYWINPSGQSFSTDDHADFARDQLGLEDDEGDGEKAGENIGALRAEKWVDVHTERQSGTGEQFVYVRTPWRDLSKAQQDAVKNVADRNGALVLDDSGKRPIEVYDARPPTTMALRKGDQTGDLFNQDDMPFNLSGEESKDATGAMDRRAESDQAKKKGTADQQTISDREEYDRIHAEMKALGMENFGTPEYNALWQQAEDIKNRHNGMPPGEKVGGSTFAVRQEAFYSRLTRTVEQSTQAKASGAQWKALIKNSKLGVNQDEFALVGVGDLEDGKTYTKQEVLDYLRANQVKIEDVTLGGVSDKEVIAAGQRLEEAGYTVDFDIGDEQALILKDDEEVNIDDLPPELQKDARTFARDGKKPQFQDYVLPGAEDGTYREVLLTLPQDQKALRAKERPHYEIAKDLDALVGREHARGIDQIRRDALTQKLTPEETAEAQAAIDAAEAKPGGRELVDEYIRSFLDKNNMGRTWTDGHGQYDEFRNPIVRLRLNERMTEDGKRMLFLEEVQPPQKGQFKRMPELFQKNWREIAFKWAIRQASERGVDLLGWTTGTQQADRYDLSQQLSRVVIGPDVKFQDDQRIYDVEGYDHSGRRVLERGSIHEQQLAEYVGKDLAAKAIAENAHGAKKEYGGLDLKVGGEGLTQLYDQDFRNVVNGLPIVRKNGQKVGRAGVAVGEQRRFVGESTLPEVVAKIDAKREIWTGPKRTPAGWHAWNVTFDNQADGVIRAMSKGATFAQAMQAYGSEGLAQVLGGEFVPEKVRSDVHALPITPEMKAAAEAGQPTFALRRGTDGVIGQVTEEGAVLARKADLNRKAHSSFGYTDRGGTGWRYNPITGKVYWWIEPTDVQREAVDDKLAGMGFTPVAHTTITRDTFEAAHGVSPEDFEKRHFGDSQALGTAKRAEDVQDAMRERRIGIRVQESPDFAQEVKDMVGRPEYQVRGMSVNEREAKKVIAEHDGNLAKLVQVLADPTQTLHPATKVALAFFVAESANKVGDFATAAEVAKQAAMEATSLGQGVNELKRWSIFSQPETAQQLLQGEIEKENNRRKEREPAIKAVTDVYAEVQREARKLLRQWLDEINGVAGKDVAELQPVDVSSLPDVTFALRADVRESGIVKVVAKMLKSSGAEATEKALVEKYGQAVEAHIPDILIEAQRSLMKRDGKAEKKFKTRIPVLSEDEIEMTLRSTRGKTEEQETMPTIEELKAQGLSDDQVEETLRQFRNRQESQADLIPKPDESGGSRLTPEQVQAAMDAAAKGGATGGQSIADMPELYDRLFEHLMLRIKEKVEGERNVPIPRGIKEQIGEILNRHGLKATEDDVKRIIGARQLLPNMTPAQAEDLANFARGIASTPLGSFERGQQTMELFSYVHDQLTPYDLVDVAFGLWYANVLSSLLTTARNVAGNASMLFLDQAAETLFRNPASYFPYLEQLAKATGDSLDESTAQGKNTMKTGQEGLTRSLSLGDERRQGVMESKNAPLRTMRSISRVATRFLSVQDLFFANTAFEMKARQLAWDQARKEASSGKLKPEQVQDRVERLLNQATDQIQTFTDRAKVEWQNLTPEIRANYDEANWQKRRVKELQMFERDKQLVSRAVDFAQKVTLDYEPEGLMGLLLGGISRVFSTAENAAQQVSNPKARMVTKAAARYARTRVIPFMRVPVNVFNRALDYGPVGYGRALMDAAGIPVLQGMKTRVRTADERADLLKRATLGTMALLPLAILARPPSPDDEPEENPWLQIHGAGSGNPNTNIGLNGPKYRPYSLELRVGDNRTFIDYRLFPLAPYLAAIGSLHDRTRYKKAMDDRSALVQGWIIAQAMKESFLSSSPITSLRELSEAAAENQPMSERSVNRTLARGTVGIAGNLIPLSGLWRSLDQLVGGDRNTRDTLLAASMAEIPVAGRLNVPSVDVLGDNMKSRAGIGWLADWSKMETPESRIYAAFAQKDVTPTDISRYQSKMTPEEYYAFAQARGKLLKDALLSQNEEGTTGLDHLLELSDKARTKDEDSPAKKYLMRISRSATRRALVQVGFKGEAETPAP